MTTGFKLIEGFATEPWLRALPEIPARRGGTRRLDTLLPGFQNVFRNSGLQQFGIKLARAILFDKTPDSNWKVPWHQDLSLAVQERVDIEGWGPWSEEEGIVHVQPPVEILEQMLTVRLHLDDCGPDNGPLRVLPGTHLKGRLTGEQIREASQHPETVCACDAGTVLVMRPLLLHASSTSTRPGHRRVVHLEFCDAELPPGIRLTI